MVSQVRDTGAFATWTRTTTISKVMLKIMSDEQLKRIMAHVLGHLESGNCLFGPAMATASSLPKEIHLLISRIKI